MWYVYVRYTYALCLLKEVRIRDLLKRVNNLSDIGETASTIMTKHIQNIGTKLRGKSGDWTEINLAVTS